MLKYPITYLLMGINTLVYLLCAYLSRDIIDMPIEILVDMGALYAPYVVLEHQWWRILSAMFLHGGMTHLLMNLFSLYLIGRGVENYFDKKSYLLLYFFSGIIGGLVSVYVHPDSVGVGASGAIFGLFGALAGFFFAHKETITSHFKAFMKEFATILGLNLIIGLSIASIDVSAHIGGLVIGAMGGFIVAKEPKFLWVYSMVMIGIILAIGEFLLGEYASVLV